MSEQSNNKRREAQAKRIAKDSWWNDPEKRRQWIDALRRERERRPRNAKTPLNFDANFVGKSGGPGYAAPWQPVRLFAPDGPVATPLGPVVGFGRLTVDADEPLAWFDKQEAKAYPTGVSR